MNARRGAFPKPFLVLAPVLAVALAACVSVAVFVQRDTSKTLRRLATVELEAAAFARQFRAEVHDLQGALFRIGSANAGDNYARIRECRARLNQWLATRQASATGEEERRTLHQLDLEMRSYFGVLDGLAARTGNFSIPLDRDSVVLSDDEAYRLQGMADDFAATHDRNLRSLLRSSLDSLLWMRDLIFTCLVLLVATFGLVVALIYRDVVRPLNEQLVNSRLLLEKREKLAALGTLAAGVAHEIRNPLTAIKARLYTLRAAAVSDGEKDDIQAITNEVDRLERIVRDVLGYARPARPVLARVELSEWLREFAAFVRPDAAGRNVQLLVDAAAPAEVSVDGNQLRQVMLNLVRNALEALADRPGRIMLSVRRERAPLNGRVTDLAVLAVTDSGPGIPKAVQQRLFDPFFTTKAGGTGLGLSIVAKLVENQGGEISFQSLAHDGARFAVRLPIRDEAIRRGSS